MNILYAIHGIPGSGKSSIIKNNGLECLTISKDSIREMVSGLDLDNDGNMVISQSSNNFVENMFKKMLEKRLSDGGIIIIDNMNIDRESIEFLNTMANNYGFEFKIVKMPNLTLSEYQYRNNNRPSYKRLNNERIKYLFDYIKSNNVDNFEKTIISPDDMVSEVKKTVEDMTVNLNKYKKIHHFGDLQGVYTPLKEYFEKNGGIKDDEFYIFVGDYIDRGTENGQTVKFLIDNINRENFVFIKGNHEIHLKNYAFGHNVYSGEFNNYTQVQIKQMKIKRINLQSVVKKLQDFFFYEFDNKKVMINHAGLIDVPEYPNMLNRLMYHKGFLSYGYDVDTGFSKNEKNQYWYQIHGHRNFEMTTFLDKNKNSWSLESDIENNGFLSVIQLDNNGFNLVKINSPLKNKKINPGDKIEEEFDMNADIIEKMQSHNLIKEKIMKSKPYISSFNFTKEAFFTKDFSDKEVVQARGLFVNNQTLEIIARGYDKFFNIGEQGIEQVSEINLKKSMKGKILTFEKENGYLGILGYDKQSNELVFASKSTIDGEFAENFKEIFYKNHGEKTAEMIKYYFKKNNKCAVFEVNDPINDPHIIDYKKQHIVLLDIMDRSFNFNKLEYNELKKIGDKLGLDVKKKGPVFKSIEDLLGFNNAISNEDPLKTSKKLEGYVVEDENCNMVKIKLPFYNYWKQMRGIKDRIKNYKEKENLKIQKINQSMDNIPEHIREEVYKKNMLKIEEEKNNFIDISLDKAFFIKENQYKDAKVFLEFLMNKNNEELNKNIIELRNEFFNNKKNVIKNKI